jgi:thioesterase domain-containing protein/acyl carrier protein
MGAREVRNRFQHFENVLADDPRGNGKAKNDVQKFLELASPEDQRKLVRDLVVRQAAEVLGIPTDQNLPIDQDLAELGVDSIKGVQIMAALGSALGQILPVAIMLEHRTLTSLSNHLVSVLFSGRPAKGSAGSGSNASSSRWRYSPLVTLRSTGNKAPLFCAPPSHGMGILFRPLSLHLGDDQPVYAFHARGVDSEDPPDNRIESMASRYIEAMREVQPRGPYHLGGYSVGAYVVYEMPAPSSDSPGRSFVSMAKLFGLPIVEEVFLGLDLAEQAAQMARAFGKLIKLPSDIGGSQRQLRVYQAAFEAIGSYIPKTYAGPVTLLRARDQVTGELRAENDIYDLTYGWGVFSLEPVRVYTVPGNHYSLAFEPHVQELGAVLRRVLHEVSR